MKALTLLTIIFMATAAHAQQPAPCLKLSRVKVDHHALHQNSATEVHLTFAGQNCYVFSGSISRPNEWPFVDFEAAPGIRIEASHGLNASRLDQSGVPFRAQELSATFTLIAVSGLELGERKIPGHIHYKAMDSQGNMSDEILAFAIPLKVKEPKKISPGPNERGLSFSDKHPIWAKVLLQLEIIAILPLWILSGLISGGSC